MKKHFLILMLMALLPLSGWAADLSKGTVVAPSPYYGDPLGVFKVYDEANQLLTKDADYVLNGYFSDEACTTEVTVAQIEAASVGSTFWVKVTGINDYENSVKGSFEIKKMALTVTFTDKTKTYLEEDPAIEIASVKDIHDNDASAAVVAAIVKGRVAGDDAAEYAYTATLDNENYTVATVTGKLTINPKGFVKGTDVTIDVTADLTYNGKAQKATVVVKDKATNETLEENKDYEITWSDNIAASAAAKADIKGKGNYKATDVNNEVFTIKTAPLLVTPTATRAYNGTATLPDVAADAFSYQGFVDDKTAANVTLTLGDIEWEAGTTAKPVSANVDENPDTISFIEFKFSSLKSDSSLAAASESAFVTVPVSSKLYKTVFLETLELSLAK